MWTKTIQFTLPRTARKTHKFIAVEAREWERMQKRMQELEHAIKVIAAGDRALQHGKTRTVRTLADLLP